MIRKPCLKKNLMKVFVIKFKQFIKINKLIDKDKRHYKFKKYYFYEGKKELHEKKIIPIKGITIIR